MPPARSDRTAKRFAECTLFTAVVIAVFSLLEMMFGQLNPEDLPSVPRSSELLMKSLRERSLERAQESAEEEDEEEEAPPAPSSEEPEAEAQLQALSELALKAEAGDAEKDESKKSLLQVTPEQVNAMRRQLQEWLRQVATFHEVESFSLMTRWLDFNTTDEVNAGLDHALRKDSEAQWVICASENEVCQCNSGHVRYGTFNKGWVTKKNKAQILCTLEKFSKTDMAYGMLKLCQCHDPPDRETGFEALKEIQTDGAARGSEGSEGETEGEKGPPGTLWASVRQVSAWVGKAEVGQLQVLARVYHLLEYTGNKAKVAAAIAKVVRKAVATSRFHCKDVPGRVANMTKCSQTSMVPCRAACSSDLELSKRSWRSELVPREEMCRSSDVEQLWSCEAASSRVPKAGHPHEEAQKVLDLTLKEKQWKYDDQHDFFKKQPDKSCYDLAQKCKVMGYAKVAQELDQLKACIKHGYPFVFGFTVLTSFSGDVAKTGNMVMPQPGDKVRGGHAVTAVGYDDFKQCFIVRNSWGESWGDKGYFYMPYAYITDPQLAQDIWAINWVEGFKNTKTKK